MCSRRSRSFPFMLLAALILLLWTLTLSFAKEKDKKDEAGNGQQPAPAATDRHHQPAAPQLPGLPRREEPGRPQATPPQPQMVPPGRQQPQMNPGWQQPQPNQGWRQPAPQENRGWRQPAPREDQGWRQPAPRESRGERPGRSDWSNPYGRTQPQEQRPTRDWSDRTMRAEPRGQRSLPTDRDPGWRSRGDQQNPYTRYRQQPQEQRRPEVQQPRLERRPAEGRVDSPLPGRIERRGESDNWKQRDREEQANPYTRYRQQPSDQRQLPRERGNDQWRTPRTQPQGEQPRPQWDRSGDRGRVAAPEVRLPQRTRPQTPNRPQTPEHPLPQTRERPGPQTRERVTVPNGQLRMRVPEARFRGPEAEKRVVAVPGHQQAQVGLRLRQQLQQWNRVEPAMRQGRITRDVVGNTIPRDAHFLDRTRITRINISYTRVEHVLGPANNFYAFIPRGPSDYWDGYWDGYGDGYRDGRHHHAPVVINFYYGYYWSDPAWFGFYYPGYYASVYHYYGYCPGWVYPTRVYVYPTDYVYWPTDPYPSYARERVDERGAERAISDIRRAWLDSDVDRLSRHLTDELDVQVYFDGKYEYTTSTEDYYGMTADALATTQTDSLEFDDPIFISSHEVFYTGRHVFYDPDGYRQVVYVSYRMRNLGGNWYIVSIGSSLEPIEHQYSDFRYN